jgi:cardiolipin synthase C
VIDSPTLAQRLTEAFDTTVPAVAYEARLGPDGRSLEWIERTAAGETRYDTEPGTTWFQRRSVDVLSIFPVDWML